MLLLAMPFHKTDMGTADGYATEDMKTTGTNKRITSKLQAHTEAREFKSRTNNEQKF